MKNVSFMEKTKQTFWPTQVLSAFEGTKVW